MSGVPQNVAYATAAIYAVLILASLIVLFLRWRNPGDAIRSSPTGPSRGGG